ncbi:MAG: oligosaccharide flippase family protein [Oscillospiraceae bacterium]|nr:oligosaccharide flippase family protein [Oscillospiraceae bacterium]
MIKQILNKIRQYAKEGLFHIFGSQVIAQVGGLISSIIVVRQLEKAAYGHYVSASNLYSYLAIFIGLGMSSAIMQYCSERVSENRKSAVYRYSFLVGSSGNILIAVVILALAYWKECGGNFEVAYYLRLMCGLPFVTYLGGYMQVVLRVKLNNRAFSYANMAYAVVLLVGNIIFTVLFGIPGLICSKYVACLVQVVLCMTALNKEHFWSKTFHEESRLERKDKRQITNYALICAITNFASTVLVLLDVTCLDMVLGESAVLADYNVASTVPSACTFIPGCLMTFFYPKLVRALSDSKEAGRTSILQLAKVYAVVNGFVYLCLAVFAPLIIWIIYGEKYMNVIPLFEILSLNYLVYCVRNLMGNVIAAIKKVKVNLIFAIISGVLDICLNLILIPVLGSAGAAIATLAVTAFIAVLDVSYVVHYLKKAE